MGSQSKINMAYIAGFLDGDGSLMIQVKKRRDLKFKKKQAEIMLKTSSLLESKKISDLNKSDLKKIINWILSIQSENYKSHRKKSKEDLVKILGLTP